MLLLEANYKKEIKEVEAQRIAIHDMKNHLANLQDLAENNDLISIKKYIAELVENSFEDDKFYYSNNYTINAILLSKVELARTHNIQIITKINVPKELHLPLYHLSIILENALDNAIQTCKVFKSDALKEIIVSCDYQQNMLLINISNPYFVEPVLCNRIKTNKKLHSFEIHSIYKSVRACNGIIDINLENMTFNLTILLTSYNRH